MPHARLPWSLMCSLEILALDLTENNRKAIGSSISLVLLRVKDKLLSIVHKKRRILKCTNNLTKTSFNTEIK